MAGALSAAACSSQDGAGPTSDAARLTAESPQAILASPELKQVAMARAETAFKRHCVICHNDNAQGRVGDHRGVSDRCRSCHEVGRHGRPGTPSLVDSEWLWGGEAEQIERTLLHGIRTDEPGAHSGEMPAFKTGTTMLKENEIHDLVEYVVQLSGREAEPQAVQRAAHNWTHCVACHGQDGRGVTSVGGSDLTDPEWIYGSDRAAIFTSIAEGRAGHCPAWQDRLDAATIRSLAVYLYSKSHPSAGANQE